MSRSGRVVSIMLVSLLVMTLIPMIPFASGGTTTLTIYQPTLPAGHGGHTPLLDTGFWFNTGTPATPMWTYYPWGTTLSHDPDFPYGQFHIKVPAQVRDSQGNNENNGHAHTFQITEFPGATVLYGPAAEPAHGGITVPTHMYILDPEVNAITTPIAGRAGPQIDVLRAPIIRSPDAALIAMQTGVVDVWSSLSSPMDSFWHKLSEADGLLRAGDIEKLIGDGHTVTYDLGFHTGHIGYNIRPLETQQVRRPELAIWPLADVNFRHALIHCYDQNTIVASIYGYTVTPVQSLIPPAQGSWISPNVPLHSYIPGNPFTSPPTEHSSCGILKAAGYVFVDADSSSTVTSADYWTIGGVKLPKMTLWTPTYETAPTSAEHGARFVMDLGEIGLAGTVENGYAGFEHEPAVFSSYVNSVHQGLFDAYMVFLNLDRFPDHLYDMCHSSQDSWFYPGRNNLPGINDPTADELVEILKTSLNHTEKLDAAWSAQERLYDPDASDQALAYMQLYSKIHFDAFNADLRGIVKSLGYGSHNKWTLLNIHWAPGTERYTLDGRTLINWILGDEPERLNPLYASTKYTWAIMSPVMDGLMMVNPYTHEDLPWLCSQMPTIVETATGMEITFYIRKDVFWQDGNPYTAYDAKFNWGFLKNNQIPRYQSMWQYIDSVVVIDDYTVKVSTNVKGQFLVYDLAAVAAMLPPPVWGWLNGMPINAILGYDPAGNTTKPTDAGPWFGTSQGPKTQLYGTGPFVFDYYDPVGMVCELHQFSGYFRITDDIHNQKVEMFHRVGDVDRDGDVWVDDRGRIAVSLWSTLGDPKYDPDADLRDDMGHPYSDGIVDIFDFVWVNMYFAELRTYPYPDGEGGGSGSSSSQSEGESFRFTGEGAESQTGEPTMYVDPAEIANCSLKTNDSFTVNITMANVIDLMGYQFKLTFNSIILNVVSVTPGDFLGADLSTVGKIDNVEGFVRFAMTPVHEPGSLRSGVSGSGILATINFTVQGYGNSSILLAGFTKLANSHGIRVEHLALNGCFDNRNPGDITGPERVPDGVVDIWDLTTVGISYGYFQGEPNYNPIADINKDGWVDIGDISVVCMNWGWDWGTDL